MSKSLLLKIYLNFSISDISGKEGITNDKLSKRPTLYALSLGQCMIKWNSSLTSELYNLHILCSTGNLLYRPLSISRLQLLIRTLSNVEILHLSTSVYKYFSVLKLALCLRYVLNLFLPQILSLFWDNKLFQKFSYLSSSLFCIDFKRATLDNVPWLSQTCLNPISVKNF